MNVTERVFSAVTWLGFAVGVGLALVPAASGQQPAVFEIVLPAGTLNTPTGNGPTIGQSLGSITAFADGEECLSAEVSAAAADVVLQFGLPGQPPACSRELAIVTFKTGQGHWLNAWFTVRPGSRFTLTNFAPTPPCEPGPCPTPGPSSPFPTVEASPTASASPTGPGPANTTGPTVQPSAGPATQTVPAAVPSSSSVIAPPSVGDGGLR